MKSTTWSKSRLAVRGVKQAPCSGQGLDLDRALEQERKQLFTMLATQDFRQRVEDFVKAREK
ncbi:MAG: hypothetical protein PHT79_11005 [Syntrophomonadaceae bacterium]|nr:hypothetical protein [Syntrophomonadaceae bacterium]